MVVHSLVGLLAVVSTVATAVLVARRRPAPTATPLLGVCLSLVGIALSAAVAGTPSPVRAAVVDAAGVGLSGELWIVLALGVALPANGLWLLFAVRHTGRGSRSRRRVPALVAVAVGACYTAPAYALFGPAGVGDGTVVAAVADALATGLFFTSALATLGSLLLLEAALRRNAVPVGEGVTLAAGASLFTYAPVIAYNLGEPAMVAALLVGASLLLAAAVGRYPVFDALPVARIAARDGLVEATDDAVVLADERGRVVELNPAAVSLFDAYPVGAARPPLDAVVPGAPDPAVLAAADRPHRLRVNGRRLEVTAGAVADEFGRSVGYLLVFRDVTGRERRERRLRLLTEFLATTVGDRAATAARRAARLTDEGGSGADDAVDPTTIGGEIRRTAGSLQRLVAATRRVERALSDHETGTCDVLTVLRDVVARRDRTTLTVAADVAEAEVTAPVDPAVLRAVVDLLIEDLTGHRGRTAELVVERAPETTVTVRVDGSPAADEPGPPAESGRSADEEASTVALSRLALERAGGRVERADGSLRVLLPTDRSTATAAADDRRGGGAGPDRSAGREPTGDRP